MSHDDKALNEFLNVFEERKRKESTRQLMELQAIEKKRAALMPIRKLLNRFVEMGLVVPDSEIGNPGVSATATKKFSFYEGESSPTWAPGASLYFDNPAQVEIAIPNEADQEKEGVIVIRSVTNHKDRNMLHQKFSSIEAVKEALAKFLGKNAVSIDRDPRTVVRKKQAVPDPAVLKGAPNEPPKDKD